MANNAFGVQGNAAAAGAWSSGLCGCVDDVGGCCLTFFCPCVTFGRIAAIVDQGGSSCCVTGSLYMLLASVTGLGACLYSCLYRSKLRSQYGLTEEPCADCCVHLCCEACALCQEYRELKARGFDMSAGWQDNMQRMGEKGAATAPPQANPGMSR